MYTNKHRIGFSLMLTLILAWAIMGFGAAGARAAKADSGAGKANDSTAVKKADLKAARKEKAAGRAKARAKSGGRGKRRRGARRPKRSGPVVVPKPVWNQKAGFGLPVPPGWSGKVEGAKIILTLSDPPKKQTTITMGPEPTELEANEYLGKICKELAQKESIMAIGLPTIEFLDRTIFLAGYPDGRLDPPGFAAVLVMDRPGDQVFVIRASTRDQSVLSDTAVMASLAMLRFRNEPLPSFGQLFGLSERKKRAKRDEIIIEPGEGTLTTITMPDMVRKEAEQIDLKRGMRRYQMAIVTPKGHDHNRVWPVLIVDAPTTDETLSMYQPLADAMRLVVVAIEPQSKSVSWPPAIQARIYFCALNRLGRQTPLDRTRVYLMGSGAAGKRVQAVGAELPLARGVICHATQEDGLTAALSKSAQAKQRLALAVAYATSSKAVTPAQADALVAAWKKAGVAAAKAFQAKGDRQAVRQAVGWLMQRDQDAIKSELTGLLARADKIAKTRPGEALTLYRRIAGSGLKNDQVRQAEKAAGQLLKEYRATKKQLLDRRGGGGTEAVIGRFKVTQRFQGTPEGNELLYLLQVSLEAE